MRHGLSRTTNDVRLRTRAQMLLWAAEHGRSAPAIATSVPEPEQPVRTWFKRYEADGAEGRNEAPRPGSPRNVTPEYRPPWAEVVRVRPRRLGLPYALWPLARVADYRAEHPGLRVEAETGRLYRQAAERGLRRPPHPLSRPAPASQVKNRRSKRHVLA
jgi:transposase